MDGSIDPIRGDCDWLSPIYGICQQFDGSIDPIRGDCDIS